MFISIATNERRMPRRLATRGKRFWRMLELSVSWPWFLLSVKDETSEGPWQSELLVSSSEDLRELLVDVGVKPCHLSVVLPPREGVRNAWETRTLRKVWCASDPDHPAAEALIFEDLEGKLFRINDPRNESVHEATRLVFDLSEAQR
jgi:hypothetical protein